MLVYANTLTIPTEPGCQPKILAALDAWLRSVSRNALTASEHINQARVRLGDGKELEACISEGFDEQANTLGCVVFSHPDRAVPGRKWFARVGFHISPSAPASIVSVVLETSDISVHAGSARVFATRPGIVPELVKRCGVVGPSPECGVHELTPENAEAFAADVRRPDRQYAIVLLSREPFSERYYVQPDEVLVQVLGLARVVVIANKAYGKPVADIVGRQFGAWGGAINVIMPPMRNGFISNRLLTADQLHYETGRDKSPAHYLLFLLTHRLNLPHYRNEITLAAVRQHDLAQKLANLKGAREDASQLRLMIELLQEQLQQKQAEVARLTDENAKAWAEYEAADQRASTVPGLQAQILSFRQAFRSMKKEGRLQSEAAPPVTSVAQAIELARNLFSEQLAFSFNSKSEDMGSVYQEPEEVFAALEWLATTYYESKTGEQACPDLDMSLAETVSGWHYAPHQKKSTMKALKEWYQCPWSDEPNGKLWIPEHLKGGATRSRRPEETIRIAFAWEPTSRKVIIGFIGQHQENTMS